MSLSGVGNGWVLDAGTSRTGVNLWVKEDGRVRQLGLEAAFPFYLTLPDEHAHWAMLEELESRYGARECTFSTIYGDCRGYLVHAGRRVAGEIERQTRYAARLYNVDVRREQQYFALHGLFPCGYQRESRFSWDFNMPLDILQIRVAGRPQCDTAITKVEVTGGDGFRECFEGSERRILDDLTETVGTLDPDLILFPNADVWMHRIVSVSREYGLDMSFSRSGRFRSLGSRSYWSYGRREYRDAAVIPEGRILIDTERSFMYREGGIRGILLASRLTALSPNLTSRFTPGTLVSGYEVFEALRRGIVVPFRKRDAERVRCCTELRAADRGGMMFQPAPGLHGRTYQIDFTSLYPSIIVKYNLSPETIGHPGRPGFLAEVLAPLLEFRVAMKQRKKEDSQLSGLDSILKWMLVTCFGYTGYKNAKFGCIEVHEQITGISREILIDVKAMAEEMGFAVLHGIVDCLWVQGEHVAAFKERVESKTGIPTECETYDWLVFLPQADGSGAYNRYYGRLTDGTVKVRGIAARRGDTPGYVRRMQHDLLSVMGEADTPAGLRAVEDRVRALYRGYREGLSSASLEDLVIRRRISRLKYSRNGLEAAAVRAFQRRGIDLAPGMEIDCVVRDADRWIVDPAWEAEVYDRRYYLGLMEKAWDEIAFAFKCGR